MHKWTILGIAGFAGGLLMLLIFRSIPMASGTAAIVAVSIIAAKHLALLVATGTPLAALLQTFKSRVRPYCPWAPRDGD